MLESSSYPRLYIPSLYPKPNPSPNRVKYKPCNFVLEWENAWDSSRWNTWWYNLVSDPFILRILIHNVYIANFAENASATGRNLERVVDQLKDMWRQVVSAAIMSGIVWFGTLETVASFRQEFGRRLIGKWELHMSSRYRASILVDAWNFVWT